MDLNIPTERSYKERQHKIRKGFFIAAAGIAVVGGLITTVDTIGNQIQKRKFKNEIVQKIDAGNYRVAEEQLSTLKAKAIFGQEELDEFRQDIVQTREAAETERIRNSLRAGIIRAYATNQELPTDAAKVFTATDLEALRTESVAHTPEGILARIRSGAGASRIEAIIEMRTSYPDHSAASGLENVELESHIDIGRSYFTTNSYAFDEILAHVRTFQHFLAERQDATDITRIREYLADASKYINSMSNCDRIEIGDEIQLAKMLGGASQNEGLYYRGNNPTNYPLGTKAKVVRVDREDDTVQLQFPDNTRVWFLENEVAAIDARTCDARGQLLVGDKVKTVAILGPVKGEAGYFSGHTVKEYPLGTQGYVVAVTEQYVRVQIPERTEPLAFISGELERTQVDFLPIIQQHLLSIEREASR